MSGLTREQELHLARLKKRSVEMLDAKYRAGAAEHGGNIWDNTVEQLIKEGLAECVDQYTYLMTLAEKLGIEV